MFVCPVLGSSMVPAITTAGSNSDTISIAKVTFLYICFLLYVVCLTHGFPLPVQARDMFRGNDTKRLMFTIP
ncbi:hypothetical protein MBAV_004722 [Candidatus Magnetobacterium bavaricum]|uniref:Uncharacterized protein n=1 Tax=Candidatus Magnetobacterium bavaricum TaxID=29290 RepID=A0A0F3GMD3_9BACT|nr:hypothetical protein MBAV_004722 [Candidatus Magnetobacterium bavaricum]